MLVVAKKLCRERSVTLGLTYCLVCGLEKKGKGSNGGMAGYLYEFGWPDLAGGLGMGPGVAGVAFISSLMGLVSLVGGLVGLVSSVGSIRCMT